jgi:hypothetical protein
MVVRLVIAGDGGRETSSNIKTQMAVNDNRRTPHVYAIVTRRFEKRGAAAHCQTLSGLVSVGILGGWEGSAKESTWPQAKERLFMFMRELDLNQNSSLRCPTRHFRSLPVSPYHKVTDFQGCLPNLSSANTPRIADSPA